MTVLESLHDPHIFLTALAVFAVIAGILLVMPIRGGTGQHAHAGPGALMVWQLQAALAAEAERVETQEEEEIRWPEDDPLEYVGRHRLWWNIDEHPPCPFEIRAAPDLLRPRCQNGALWHYPGVEITLAS